MSSLGTPATQQAVASRLREILSSTTESKRLQRYRDLWGLEFRNTPPPQHAALRTQIAADVKRLAELNPQPDARYLELMAAGYKQVGDTAAVTAAEDRLLKEHAGTETAFWVEYQRWKKNDPDLPPGSTNEQWQAQFKNGLAQIEKWRQQYPEVSALRSFRFETLQNLDGADAAVVAQAGEEMLRANEEVFGPSMYGNFDVARYLTRVNRQPERALQLVSAAMAQMERNKATDYRRDNYGPTEMQNRDNHWQRTRFYVLEHALRAYRAFARPELAKPLHDEIESAAKPEKAEEISWYWTRRGLLAEVEGRRADALTYYQSALQARPKDPDPRYGKPNDDLLADARRLYTELGGTATAFELWRKPARDVPKAELAQGRWEQPKKEMPSWALTDLAGKQWTLKQLEGKTVLVNLWATWCGPCRAELPHFQKLHDRLKDRPDIAVISMNVDDELGLVEPYMTENKYSFPVLSALSFVNQLLDGLSIPRNWIIDKRGKWVAEQIGFDSQAKDWEAAMIARLEATQ